MAWAVLPVAGVLMLAGCSDDKKDDSKSSSPSASAPAAQSSAPSAPSSAPAPASSAPAAGNTATFNADQQAAAATVNKMFDGKQSVADRKALIQNADQIDPVIQALLTNPLIGQVSTTVKDAQLSGDKGAVTVDISAGGAVVAPSVPVEVVKKDGKWLVSAKMICGLASQYGGVPAASLPPACAG
ncbi:hypothetical protein [Yinghuangia seranimata]|uniref:hypothetical protein n=1 Tax=Yinghuangia seranimata TaxID=408067 RepID=UPI00248C47DB|nr:hypothetical protein [Yinghuangia seranimata]MDI2126372.1 hypothetical protein [Yinghuangia seranimata]